ncbi:FAD-binding oxidoreductase [Frankia sp. Cppng1_Ct_nod]|uniref:FAD-binding oxidoreductase n=1 Tax=Frankia sp. Cppng1_Ct_nod TaxID=2897162 RepID=UPI0020247447|nr:FAD-binding oxidoreductase [Frankia sp. Cppng1_Ct_nod]
MTGCDEAGGDGSGMVWWGWGAPGRHTPLPEGVRSLLEQGLGVTRHDTPPVDPAELRLPVAQLTGDARDALIGAVGSAWVRDDATSRVRHCRGRSTVDLLRLRAGDALDAPDAVVLPADHDEVLAVLRVCAAHRVAVVPFGGGTSVVGGLAPVRGGLAGVIALDVARMNLLLGVDAESQIATCEPGLRGPALEAALAIHGFTLGHLPQSWEYATVGGFAATRSSGQASAGYGRFDSVVVGVRIATPAGSWELGHAPASAAGPDLRQLVLGSEGAFGVITQVRLRVRPVPEKKIHEGWRLADFTGATALLRAMAQRDLLPTVMRLSDEVETAAGLATARPGSDAGTGGCLLITGYEGRAGWVDARRAEVAGLLRAAGAVALGEDAGAQWAHGRFDGPYLRDALLDVGMFAETLETAGFWSALSGLHTGVRDALTAALAAEGTPGLVMGHISHVYPTGASLYFTVVCGQVDDSVARWRRVKAAASRVITEAGATITHHHAVGTDHRPWLAAEIGDIGVAVLRAVKNTLDPVGILNPGVLLP